MESNLCFKLLSSDSKLNYSYILLTIKLHVNLAGLQF